MSFCSQGEGSAQPPTIGRPVGGGWADPSDGGPPRQTPQYRLPPGCRLPWIGQIPPDADPLGLDRPPPRCRPPQVRQTIQMHTPNLPPGLGRPPSMQPPPLGLGKPPRMQTPGLGRPPPHTVNKRSVSILLECILVVYHVSLLIVHQRDVFYHCSRCSKHFHARDYKIASECYDCCI